jgi:hypothetical protein
VSDESRIGGGGKDMDAACDEGRSKTEELGELSKDEDVSYGGQE